MDRWRRRRWLDTRRQRKRRTRCVERCCTPAIATTINTTSGRITKSATFFSALAYGGGAIFLSPTMSNRLQIPRNDEIEILNVETPFEGYFRVDRYRFRHRLYRGGWSAEVSREVFERGHAVGVLLYDPPLDRVVLVEQIRLPSLIGGGPARTLEIAAGIIDPGETIARVARREAHEETGLNILALKKICRYFA
ncbi:MAG: NUDIX domain-containing protein, partial [Alphaproteobacteria bacterium]|nr:NUDIX domain-containing protein [Alphaproteobacteria bacterium]